MTMRSRMRRRKSRKASLSGEPQASVEPFSGEVKNVEDGSSGLAQERESKSDSSSEQASKETPDGAARLTGELDFDVDQVKKWFGTACDIVYETFTVLGIRRATLIYIDGLVNTQQMDTNALGPLKSLRKETESRAFSLELLAGQVIDVCKITWVQTLEEISQQVLTAQSVLLVDGEEAGLALSMAGGEQRGVEEPSTEAVIRGPREGFNESVSTGTALLRRRLRTPDLQLEEFRVGTYTGTKIVLCSIKGIAADELVAEVRERLQRIEIDGILESGYIEELIEDAPYSPFPQMQNTERPDVVAGLLLEGSIAILVDGTPFALLGPINLWGALQSAEDFYERYLVATLIRWLRYVFLGIALFLPSLYVAITTFHQEMLPNKLLLSVAAAREVTPFPAVVEALFMEITFEALREAGVRLPKTVGSAISIVGALVIGQAAVQAGIASAPMVIIVSVTGIASFTIPRYNFALSLRMLRFPMIILAGTLGLYGIMLGLLAVIVHLSSLRSFGVPYLQPVSPLKLKNLKDVFIRAPHWAMNQRPWQTAKANALRQTEATRPKHRVPPHKR